MSKLKWIGLIILIICCAVLITNNLPLISQTEPIEKYDWHIIPIEDNNESEYTQLTIHTNENETIFPVYKQDGTYVGWIINGNFTTKMPYDIWISCRFNTTWRGIPMEVNYSYPLIPG